MIQEFISGTKIILIYILIAVTVVFSMRAVLNLPKEVFRKLLHCIFIGFIIPLVFYFEHWYVSVAFCIAIIIVVYPIFIILEKYEWFSVLLTERKKGEIKSSLVLAFSTYAAVISVCWGIFDDKYLVLASVSAWALGDAAAALIGKKYGKTKITLPHADGRKSVQGSASMFIVSFASVLTVLMIRGGMSVPRCVITALLTAAVSTAAELYSKNGNDTVFCPLSAMAVLILLIYLV